MSGVGDKATSILSLLLSSLCSLSHPKLVHIYLFLSSLFLFLHLTSCHSPLCACLLTQNWCIPEWDNSKDSRLQVMSAASHYNWTFCGPVSATALFCICVFLNLYLNSDSYLLSTGPDAVVQFLLQLCFVYVWFDYGPVFCNSKFVHCPIITLQCLFVYFQLGHTATKNMSHKSAETAHSS